MSKVLAGLRGGHAAPALSRVALAALLIVAVTWSGCTQEPESTEGDAETAETTELTEATTPGPWAEPPPPPKSAYDGPLFTLSYDYPTQPVPPPDPPPWREAIGNGTINVDNAGAYTQALKDYVAPDMETLLFDYSSWDPQAARWYNQPWLASIRDSIHGTYVGSTFPPEMFPASGLSETMTTHVLVYYDAVSAYSMERVWGSSGMDPVPGMEAGGAQFPEGGVIVKPAFTTADGSAWPPIEGAYPWQIWAKPGDGGSGERELQEVYLFQFDIIVKDSASSPETGWVFTTLVYDKSVAGSSWEQMVPLGAMWGNDPDVDSPQGCDPTTPGSCPQLEETWINAEAPAYAKETLGWGGRLSGPNDGAVDLSPAVQTASGDLEPYSGRYAMSSCMSCHGAAEYEMESFLLPSPAKCQDDDCTPTFAKCQDGSCQEVPPGTDGSVLVYYQSGDADFMRWFQDRPGDVPMDEGTIPLDYGMNYAFKALPSWYRATQDKDLNFVKEFNFYRGTHHEPLIERDE